MASSWEPPRFLHHADPFSFFVTPAEDRNAPAAEVSLPTQPVSFHKLVQLQSTGHPAGSNLRQPQSPTLNTHRSAPDLAEQGKFHSKSFSFEDLSKNTREKLDPNSVNAAYLPQHQPWYTPLQNMQQDLMQAGSTHLSHRPGNPIGSFFDGLSYRSPPDYNSNMNVIKPHGLSVAGASPIASSQQQQQRYISELHGSNPQPTK